MERTLYGLDGQNCNEENLTPFIEHVIRETNMDDVFLTYLQRKFGVTEEQLVQALKHTSPEEFI